MWERRGRGIPQYIAHRMARSSLPPSLLSHFSLLCSPLSLPLARSALAPRSSFPLSPDTASPCTPLTEDTPRTQRCAPSKPDTGHHSEPTRAAGDDPESQAQAHAQTKAKPQGREGRVACTVRRDASARKTKQSEETSRSVSFRDVSLACDPSHTPVVSRNKHVRGTVDATPKHECQARMAAGNSQPKNRYAAGVDGHVGSM